jgi:hypothetical protein
MMDSVGDDDSAGTTERVAVIGDLAGHLDELRGELRRLGADGTTGRLPDGLTVIQVGDLVHRGPDSESVIALVDGYLRTQPDQWIQLIGNHEAQYVRPPAFEWRERIDDTAVDTLRRWWAGGRLLAAASVRTPRGDYLITHAGVTAPFWRDVLGMAASAADAATALNNLIATEDERLFSAGHVLGGGRPDPWAGPLWAATSTELVPSWFGVPMPFSQVHGHATIVDWGSGRLNADPAVAERTSFDEEAKHEIVQLDGGVIIGVDPRHGRRARRPWRALELRAG